MGNNSLKIAILSGKGGTGKTLVSVNMAVSAGKAVYIDCDVEEPNGHLFLNPDDIESEEVTVKMPVIDYSLCSGCRKCVDFCRFNALAFIGEKPIVFEDICHPCGGCAMLCPENAICEADRVIGEIQKGTRDKVTVYTGFLNTGEETGVPIIKKLLETSGTKDEGLRIIDCPPGSNCVVMESIKDADYCILVAEPTVFGAHNLSMVYELVSLFNKPHGVVLNKCLEGENPSETFCTENRISVLGRIPFDAELGRLNSDGKIVSDEIPKYKELFSSLLKKVTEEVRRETASNP